MNQAMNVELADLLPQKGRMLLLTDYAAPEADDAAEAFVDIGPDSAFFDRSLGGVPSCLALEYMAQTMALLVGMMRRRQKKNPQLGFVLGSRCLEIHAPYFAPGERYRITAHCTYEDESFGSFDCVIYNKENQVMASGTLTAFQPPEDTTLDQLEGLL